jgi:hypothetical protein
MNIKKLIVMFIILSKITKEFKIGSYNFGNVLSVGLIAVATIFMVSELLKCRVKYKYCIIGDKFVIHKFINSDDKIVENIKIKDIKNIRKCSKLAAALDILNLNKYICSFMKREIYCCKYYESGKLKKFYFEPSISLLETINHLLNKSIAG